MKKYHKLVRDRIPEIIETSGKTCVYETLSDNDYVHLLDEKLNEELAEYQESKSLEELADLLEVIRAVVKARGWTMEELERVRASKEAERGGFEKRILLQEIREKCEMDTIRARELLTALADGIDPFTGEVFPKEHICNHPDIIRAFHQVLGSVQGQKKDDRAPNAGKPWPQMEKDKLIDEFHSGMKVSAMAKEHGRTRGSIEAKLAELNLIESSYFSRKQR